MIEEQMDRGKPRGGFRFVNEDPQVTMKRTGYYKGVSGAYHFKKDIDIDAFNKEVRIWGNKVAGILRDVVRSSFHRGKDQSVTYKSGIHKGKVEGKLANSLRARFRKERGGAQIEVIGFNLERHGVFLQKGVGRGYVAQGDGVARIAKSDESTRYRFKKDWFNSTLDNNIQSLSNTIVKHTGDAIVLNTKRMFIQ